MSGGDGRFIEANGIRFHVVEAGSGRPVVLLHGFPDSSRLWRHQIPALVEGGFRCIAPDLRGFGESDRPPDVKAYAMPLIFQDVTGIMDELGVDRAAIVGHDWGAGVGWLLASLAPGRVDSLVALSVGHPSGLRRPWLRQLQKSWYMFFFQFPGIAEELLQRNDWELFRVWLDGASDTESYIRDMSRPGALTAGLNWYRANVSPESLLMSRGELPSVSVPVTGVWGAADAYLTEELMARSAEFVEADWHYERWDEAGHWIPLDQPERLNRLLLDSLWST